MVAVEPYTYTLSPDRIAQRPVHPPESALMMVVDRERGALRDGRFADLPDMVTADDVLVFNDTKVIPARLLGELENEARTPVELLLVDRMSHDTWLCLGRPLRKIRSVGAVRLNDSLRAIVEPHEAIDRVLVRFETSDPEGIQAALHKHGIMPIPPYIRNGRSDDQDALDYQSIFALKAGSIAAPTASLHFSPTLVERLRSEARCAIVTVTLHVGSASFLPVLVEGSLRPPGSESLFVPPSVINCIQETRARGRGRIIAVGTTVVRALEGAFSNLSVGTRQGLEESEVIAQRNGVSGSTELFIQPGYKFQAIDGLVTNFHQPGTTHLLLVEALVGRDLLACAYSRALDTSYRFLSYGDGMLIL